MRIPKISPAIVSDPPRQTIYVQDAELHIDGDHLIVEVWEKPSQVYPLNTLQSVLGFGAVQIPYRVMNTFLRSQITTTLFDRSGKVIGRLEPIYTDRPDVIRAQAFMTDTERSHLTQRVIWGALRAHRRQLLRSQREHQTELTESLRQLDWAITATERIERVRTATPDEIAGMLGAGLSRYYPALFSALRFEGWEWLGRKDRTPLNAMLEVLYALLESSVLTAIASVGLSPDQGVWHTGTYRRNNLVKDLAIEFRSYADAVLIRCINRQQIALKDFDHWDGQVPVSVVKTLTATYKRKMSDEMFTYPGSSLRCSYEQAMVIQARQIAAYLIGDISEFCPLNVK